MKQIIGMSPSRKKQMTLIGLFCIGSTYAASLGMFFAKPETAASVASLGQVTIVAIGGMIATYVGAQGYVDGKSTQTPDAPPPPSGPPPG